MPQFVYARLEREERERGYDVYPLHPRARVPPNYLSAAAAAVLKQSHLITDISNCSVSAAAAVRFFAFVCVYKKDNNFKIRPTMMCAKGAEYKHLQWVIFVNRLKYN